MALMSNSQIHPGKITGIDISEGMMQYGRIKIQEKGPERKNTIKLG